MSNFNDLYNTQDVILLCKNFENRFQAMYEKSAFNPRKCNSVSKLSGCIQKEQSKVIVALPTNNSIMEIFEKTLTGGFAVSTLDYLSPTNFWCRIWPIQITKKWVLMRVLKPTNATF